MRAGGRMHFRWQALALVVLFLFAVWLRVTNLLLIPRFEDESLEVLVGLAIARGERWPLAGDGGYYGPLFAYLVAGLFALLGEHELWPRAMVAILGAATVPVTFVLGRAVANVGVGWFAALLTATSPMLVLFGSRFGWSNSLTPFLATATLAATVTAFERRTSVWAAFAGLLAGLTLQSHPLSFVFVVAIGLWYLWHTPLSQWMQRPDLRAWIAGVMAGALPLLLNFLFDFAAVVVEVRGKTYAFAPPETPVQYASRIPGLAMAVVFVAAGVRERMFEAWAELPIVAALVELTAATAIVGAFVYAVRHRHELRAGVTLVAWVIVTSCVLLPVVVRQPQSRYLFCLLPALFVLTAVWIQRLWSHSARRRSVIVVAGLGFVASNLAGMTFRQAAFRAAGITNEPLLAMRHTVRQNGGCQSGVLMEDVGARGWSETDNGWVGFNAESARYLLLLEQCPVVVASADDIAAMLDRRENGVDWIIASADSETRLMRTSSLARSSVIAPQPVVTSGRELRLYRRIRTE